MVGKMSSGNNGLSYKKDMGRLIRCLEEQWKGERVG